MSIPSYASKIKSSGIYRYVFDKSVVPVNERKTLRMLIGYSEKGAFNTPVYIEEDKDFIRQFGPISRRMERKGIFFHRMALQALQAGPILVLNLKPFNADPDCPEKTEIYAFNASDLIAGNNTNKGSVLVAPNGTTRGVGLGTVYDTNRFWTIDPQRLHEMHGGAGLKDSVNDYIRILQTSSKEDSCTIFVRAYKPTNYDIKISDWYAGVGSEMPAYMSAIQDHMLSEYFAEVFVFKGNLVDEELFKHTGTLGSFRNLKFKYTRYVTKATNTDGLAVVLTDEAKAKKQSFVNGDKYYTLEDGAIIEYEVGNKDYKVVKNEYRTITGQLVQLTGIEGPNGPIEDINTLIKKQFALAGVDVPEVLAPEHERILSWQPFCIISDGIVRANPDYVDHYDRPADALGAMSDTSTSGFVGNYNGILFPGFRDATGPFLSLDTRFNADFKEHKMLMQFNELLLEKAMDLDTDDDYEYGAGENPFHIKTNVKGDVSARVGVANNHMYSPAQAIQMLCSPTTALNRTDIVTLDGTLMDKYTKEIKGATFAYDALTKEEKCEVIVGALKKLDEAGSMVIGGEYIKFIEDNGTKVQKAEVKKLTGAHSGKTSRDWKDANVTMSTPGIYIKGYDYKSIKRGDSGQVLIDKIMSVLGYKGIREALTNNVDVDYHYIIDTFQAFPGMSMKAEYFNIARDKDNGFVLANFPTIDNLMRHVGYAGHRGGFDMNDIIKPSSGISLPSDAQGASFGAFYTQLMFTDGSQKFAVPSAALVSNLFMEKWKTRQPYYIVAGPNHGRIESLGLVSPDYSYSRPDLDVLEPLGVNAIIHMPRHGIVINSNQTAKQTPVSALSKINVRELIIYLQNEIEDMLRGYQWELNTQTLRNTIKAKADNLLEVIKANGGVYEYETRCDEHNNTPEVIDNEMIILDIDIEPARGAGKMIQTLTIHRTGGIKSGK